MECANGAILPKERSSTPASIHPPNTARNLRDRLLHVASQLNLYFSASICIHDSTVRTLQRFKAPAFS
jgi:hypothetical protein